MLPIDSSCQQLGQVSRWNGEGNETAIDGQYRADSLVAKGLSYRGGCVPWFAVPLGGERDPGEQPHPQKSGEDIRHEAAPRGNHVINRPATAGAANCATPCKLAK